MRIAVPDLITNSYFPALAAEELGLYRREGLEAHVELLSPADRGMTALRDGEVQLVAGGAHSALTAFPGWNGAKLVVAIAQGTPWLLVVRADLPAARGDVHAVKGLRIGAAPGPDLALARLLADSGIDSEREVHIARVPGTHRPGVSFGVAAAEALESRQIDGFWANALGSEVAVRRGVGRIIVDVRRGDGPADARDYTLAALVATDALIANDPARVSAAVRAIVSAHRVLRADPERALEVGRRRFPTAAAEIIADLVAQDLPFYDPVLHEDRILTMNRFAQSLGLLAAPVAYEDVVAIRFRPLWTAAEPT